MRFTIGFFAALVYRKVVFLSGWKTDSWTILTQVLMGFYLYDLCYKIGTGAPNSELERYIISQEIYTSRDVILTFALAQIVFAAFIFYAAGDTLKHAITQRLRWLAIGSGLTFVLSFAYNIWVSADIAGPQTRRVFIVAGIVILYDLLRHIMLTVVWPEEPILELLALFREIWGDRKIRNFRFRRKLK